MELISTWLFETYQFLASIKVPGFDISFIQLFLGVYAVIVSIGFAKMFLGLGGDAIMAAKTVVQKGGNNKKLKIVKERKKDKK